MRKSDALLQQQQEEKQQEQAQTQAQEQDNKKNKNKNKNKNKSGLEQFGTTKLHKSWILFHLHVHLSFAISEKPCSPRRTFPLAAMCLLQLSLHVTLSIDILA